MNFRHVLRTGSQQKVTTPCFCLLIIDDICVPAFKISNPNQLDRHATDLEDQNIFTRLFAATLKSYSYRQAEKPGDRLSLARAHCARKRCVTRSEKDRCQVSEHAAGHGLDLPFGAKLQGFMSCISIRLPESFSTPLAMGLCYHPEEVLLIRQQASAACYTGLESRRQRSLLPEA